MMIDVNNGLLNCCLRLLQVQRMGKYALLLHNIAKHSDVQYRSQLREAEALVKFQLRHGNDLLSMDSIVNCDVNLKEQGELMRQVGCNGLG